jgi:GNAT superfamily N-acetyltransferase
MLYRSIEREEIDMICEIDRAEIIEHVYYFRKGKLELLEEYWDVKGWDPDHLESCIKALNTTIDTNGYVFGAFDNGKLAGIVSLESTFMGLNMSYLKLDKLYVSKKYRNNGIARALMDMAKEKAKVLGAQKLYISATPSENTVKFYMNIGCKLTEELIPELFELEPEDIHLEMVL